MGRALQFALMMLVSFVPDAYAQTSLELSSAGWRGVLHDNLANAKRQGSGFSPLSPKSHRGVTLYRRDAVGLNFEHIFNGAAKQYDLSMFTPRKDPCELKKVDADHYRLRWPAENSSWGLEAQMTYDLSAEGYIDLAFECTPTKDLYPQGYVAMMWASYMHRAVDRRIHFWGVDGERTGWVSFGEGEAKEIEVGTVSHGSVKELPFEEGAQTLNLVEHPRKKFDTPFYYGLIESDSIDGTRIDGDSELDGDSDLARPGDPWLYLIMFDQTESIRFAMWNFYTDAKGNPDTHSPAWDWQYVIREPRVGQRYTYQARLVIKPFQGKDQVWEEYRKWNQRLGHQLPLGPTAP